MMINWRVLKWPVPSLLKQFLKTKNLSLSKEDGGPNRVYPKEASRHPLGFDHKSPAPQTQACGLYCQQPFLEGWSPADEEEEDDDTCLRSTAGQIRNSRVSANALP